MSLIAQDPKVIALMEQMLDAAGALTKGATSSVSPTSSLALANAARVVIEARAALAAQR